MLKKILFFVDNFNLSSISIYNYALYNEAILNNLVHFFSILRLFTNSFFLEMCNILNSLKNSKQINYTHS